MDHIIYYQHSTLPIFVGIYYFTLFSYTLLILNIFYILFNLNNFQVNSIELVKFILQNRFYTYSFLLTLLSLAGVPPLLGFTIKIFQLYFFINILHIPFLIFFIIYNVLTMYFYFNNFKYLLSYSPNFV